MTVFPVIVVYIFLQKYIVGGVVAGAVNHEKITRFTLEFIVKRAGLFE